METLFGFLQLQAPAYAVPEPLVDLMSDFLYTRSFGTKLFGENRLENFTLIAHTNGTFRFRDRSDSLKLNPPDAQLLNGTLSVKKNSTDVVLEIRNASNHFIREVWKYNPNQQSSAISFKLTLCWNLPTARDIKIPLGRWARLHTGIIRFGEVIFDWNDAMRAGFNPRFDATIFAIVVPVSSSGCLDPTITTSTNANAIANGSTIKIAVGQGNDWVFYQDTGIKIRGKYQNTSAWSEAGIIWPNATSPSISGSASTLSIWSNNTHIFLAFVDLTSGTNRWIRFRLFKMQPTAFTLQANANITFPESMSGVNSLSLTTNSSGFPVIVYQSTTTTGSQEKCYLIKASDRNGATWESTITLEANCGINAKIQVVRLNSGNLMVLRSNASTAIRTIMYYQNNRTVGSQVTISGTNINNFRAVSVSGRVHLSYVDSNALKYRNSTGSGAPFSSEQTIVSSGVVNDGSSGAGSSLSAVNATGSTFKLIFPYATTNNQIRVAETNSGTTVTKDAIAGNGYTSPKDLNAIPYFNFTINPSFTRIIMLARSGASSPYFITALEYLNSYNGAGVAYRSNTGTNTLNSPKYREWNPFVEPWTSEVELPTAGSPIRFAQLVFSPISTKRVLITLSDDSYLDSYVCWSSCRTASNWTVTNNIAQVWSAAPTGAQRPYDLAFERTSGNLLLVYDKVSASSSQDLFYRTLSASSNSTWGSESSFNDSTSSLTDTVYSFVRLATDFSGGNRIGIIALDQSNNDTLAWIWSSANSTVSNQIELTSSASIGTEEAVGIAFERLSGNLMIVSGEGSAGVVRYVRFTTSWQTSATITPEGNATNWITLHANPNPKSNELFLTIVDDASDANTAYWSGSAWTVHSELDSNIDTHSTRPIDFSWNGYNSSGIIIWGTSSGVLNYQRFKAPNTFTSGTFTETGTHPWVQLADPPSLVTSYAGALGATLDSLLTIGGFGWRGGSTSTSTIASSGDAGISTNTTVSTYEAFKVAWQVYPAITQIQYWTDTSVAFSTESEGEPHLAVSNKTNTLVMSHIRVMSGQVSKCAARRSFDGGATWAAAIQIGNVSVTNANQNHSVVAVDSTGKFRIVCVQSKTPTHNQNYIFTSLSSNDGLSWGSPQVVSSATDPVILDKPWIAIDTRSSDFKDNTYVCWTRNNGTSSKSEIMFKKIASSNSTEKVLYRVNKTATSFLTGCNMAVGPTGEVYVTWLHVLSSTQASIEFRWNELGDTDWGWGRVHNVTATPLTGFPITGCPLGTQACLTGTSGTKFGVTNDPSIAVDKLGGVHITYADYSASTGGDIKYVNSDDCKKNSVVDICAWSTPLVISMDLAGAANSKDQWEPAIHVSNMTSTSNPRGTIHITALDRRDDANNVKWKVYHYFCVPSTLSTCISASGWTNEPVSDVQLDNAGQERIGEYHGITNTITKEAYTVWTDSRNFAANGFDIYADWRVR